MQMDGCPKLVHRLAFHADEERERVAMLFDSYALGHGGDEAVRAGTGGKAAAADAVLHVFDARAFLGPLGQMDHACAMQGNDGFLGIVLEILAYDKHGLTLPKAIRVRVCDVSRQGDVPGHSSPEIAELIADIPDVVASGVDGVLLGGRVVTGAARHDGAANVGLALEDADWCIESGTRPVKGRRWGYLGVRCRRRLRPIWHRLTGCGWSDRCLRADLKHYSAGKT